MFFRRKKIKNKNDFTELNVVEFIEIFFFFFFTFGYKNRSPEKMLIGFNIVGLILIFFYLEKCCRGTKNLIGYGTMIFLYVCV